LKARSDQRNLAEVKGLEEPFFVTQFPELGAAATSTGAATAAAGAAGTASAPVTATVPMPSTMVPVVSTTVAKRRIRYSPLWYHF